MKKKLSTILAVLMLVCATAAVFAIAVEDEPAPPSPYYTPVTGTVTSVDEYIGADDKAVDGWYFINIELEDDAVAVFLVTDTTVYPFSSEIKAGDEVTGYYRTGMPMIMIYPPRYSIDVLVAGVTEGQSVKVDRFTTDENATDGRLVSDDGELAIRIGDDTAVTTPDGTEYDGELDGRGLVVIYDVSTRSIPAQTTPISVIVLPKAEEPVEEISETVIDLDVANMPLIVNGEEIDAPAAYLAGNDIVMIPLRAVAEALGHTVTWDAETRSVKIGDDIEITLDSTNCKAGGKEILLATAPELTGSHTYVPLRFFKDAAGVNNAYVFEDQIVIDSEGEIME